MSLPTSVADVIQQHVTLAVERLDRPYLNIIQARMRERVRNLAQVLACTRILAISATGAAQPIFGRVARPESSKGVL